MGKGDEDKTSMAESFINFQIQVKRKEIQEFKDDVVVLEGKKQKLIELRDQMLHEQKSHIAVLRQQAKEQQRNLEQKGEANKEQVEEALRQNHDLSRTKKKELDELNQVLRNLDEQELLLRAEMEIWQQYKNTGRYKDEDQIKQLKDELSGLQKGFEEMSENIHRSLEVTFSEIDKNKVQLLDVKKNLATERAIKHLDKNTRQEVKENAWLLKEVALFKKEVSLMEEGVQKLEEENIKLSGEIHAQQLEDLQISGNFFLTQAVGLEPGDCQTLRKTFRKIDFNVPTGEHAHGQVPVVQAKEESGEGSWQSQASDQTADQYRGRGIGHNKRTPAQSCETAWPQDLNGLLFGTHTYFNDSMHLGSLAQKLLSVVGQAAPLHSISSQTHRSAPSMHPPP